MAKDTTTKTESTSAATVPAPPTFTTGQLYVRRILLEARLGTLLRSHEVGPEAAAKQAAECAAVQTELAATVDGLCHQAAWLLTGVLADALQRSGK